MINIGITGSSGNIGLALQKVLCKKYNLFLFDIKETEPICAAPFTKIDFTKKEEMRGFFDGLDIIIHLSGNAKPDSPRELINKNNFLSTSYIFEEAKLAGVKKIIYASSNYYHEKDIRDFTFGYFKKLITIDSPPSPISFYGESKVYGENLGKHFSYLGIKFIALRIGWFVPKNEILKYFYRYSIHSFFCSEKDLVQAFEKSIQVEEDFLVAIITSNNTDNVFDLTETREKLGFIPQDNIEDYFKENISYISRLLYRLKKLLRKIIQRFLP